MLRVLAMVLLLGPLAAAYGAERRAVRLEYTALPTCPTKAGFEARLAARLGYDPISAPATHVAAVAVQVREGLLEATFTLSENGGPKRGDRLFSGPVNDCDGLLSSVALALAIALDPRLLTRPPVEPAPPPVSQPVIPAPAPPIEPLRPTLPSDVHWQVAVGARGAVGLLPAASAGPTLEARLRIGSFSVALDGDVLLAQTVELAGGRIETSLVRAGIQLCGHVAFASLCARGTGGAVEAGGAGFANNRRGWHGVATIGPMLAATWALVSGLFLQASLAMDVVLVRSAITLGATELWNSPVLSGNAGLLIGWQFL